MVRAGMVAGWRASPDGVYSRRYHPVVAVHRFRSNYSFGSKQPLAWARCASPIWIDSSRVLYCSSSASSDVLFQGHQRLPDQGWADARAGRRSTASQINSDPAAERILDSSSKLILLDIRTGEARVLVDSGLKHFKLSPTKTSIAIIRGFSVSLPEPDARLDTDREIGWLEVLDIDGRLMYSGAPTEVDCQIGTWSRKGDAIAYWVSDRRHTRPPSLFRFDVPRGRKERISVSGLDVTKTARLYGPAQGHLVIKAMPWNSPETRAPRTGRFDWYELDGKHTRNLTSGLPMPPASLYSFDQVNSLFGASGGELWRLYENGDLTRSRGAVVMETESTSLGYYQRVMIHRTGGCCFTHPSAMARMAVW